MACSFAGSILLFGERRPGLRVRRLGGGGRGADERESEEYRSDAHDALRSVKRVRSDTTLTPQLLTSPISGGAQ